MFKKKKNNQNQNQIESFFFFFSVLRRRSHNNYLAKLNKMSAGVNIELPSIVQNDLNPKTVLSPASLPPSTPLQPTVAPPKRTSFTKSNNLTSIYGVLKQNLLHILVIIIVLLITAICFCLILIYEQKSNVTHSIDAWKDDLTAEQGIWYNIALDELKTALKVQLNTRRAKNVILFVGDGMGINTVTASRIYKYGEEGRLAWETFPHLGLLKVCKKKPSCVFIE